MGLHIPSLNTKKNKNCPILSLNLDFDGQAASILALTGNIIYKKTSIKDAKLQKTREGLKVAVQRLST